MSLHRCLTRATLLAKNAHHINSFTIPTSKLHTQTACRLGLNHMYQFQSSRQCSTDAAIAPPSIEGERSYPPKIQKLVDDISELTLIEVADLNELLKKTLKIADAPMMAMGAMASGPAAPQAAEEEEVEQKQVKMAYAVKLVSFEESKKVALIKAIKATIEGMNLVQAKKFVESAPSEVKGDLVKAEAEELQKKLEEAGGKIEIV